MYQAIPGDWRWEMAYRVPDLYRWTIHTYGEDEVYTYDGDASRAFVGGRPVAIERATAASVRTHARWMAVTALDVLVERGDVRWSELRRDELPPGAARGLRARYVDGAEDYLLLFDEALRLVAAEGPLAIPPLGSGRLRASYSDFRPVRGYELPFAGRYTFHGEPLFDERVLDYVPNDPGLGAESFRRAPATGRPRSTLPRRSSRDP